MPQRDISLVTVFFKTESDLVLLQARSLARYLPEGFCSQIIVVDNGDTLMSQRWRSQVLTAYGRHAPLVSFRTRGDVVPSDAPGWVSQQLIKLAISSDIRTSGYVVLDAKNHLVGPIDMSDILGSDGRWHLKRNAYTSHPLRGFVNNTLSFVGLEPNLEDETLPGTTTPFVFNTAQARDLWAWLGTAGTGDPAQTFTENSLIEFVLYGTRLKALGTLDSIHDDQEIGCTNIWPKTYSTEGVVSHLRTVRDRPFLSVHRAALARLTWGAMRALVAFWCEKDLFENKLSAWVFLMRCRGRIVLHAVLARLK